MRKDLKGIAGVKRSILSMWAQAVETLQKKDPF